MYISVRKLMRKGALRLLLQRVERLHRLLRRLMRARWIRARHDASVGHREAVPRPRWAHVRRAAGCCARLDGRPVPALDRVEHAFFLLAARREAGHALAADDGFVGGGVADAREDGAAVADGGENAAVGGINVGGK